MIIGGHVRGSWKAAPPAQLLLVPGIFLDVISPDVFRHAFTSQFIVNDELVVLSTMNLFLMVESQGENWSRTHRYLVHLPMSSNRRMQDNVGHAIFSESRVPAKFLCGYVVALIFSGVVP